MIEIPPVPPSNHRVNKTQVSNKDTHHEREKKKQSHPESLEVEDEITLENNQPPEKKDGTPKKPQTPLSGHINIEA